MRLRARRVGVERLAAAQALVEQAKVGTERAEPRFSVHRSRQLVGAEDVVAGSEAEVGSRGADAACTKALATLVDEDTHGGKDVMDLLREVELFCASALLYFSIEIV